MEQKTRSRFKQGTTGLLIILLLLLTSFAGCIQEDLQLDTVEIRDYQGQRLSSVNDFRENSIKGPQYIDQDNYTLSVTGLVTTPKTYSYDAILAMFQTYKKVVTLYCVEGWDVQILWDGILVKDILEQAIPSPNATTVIFYAYDGYSTSLPLDYIIESNILIAHKMNNVTLPPERGFPFQLVAESKWGYKWIKWIVAIEVSDDTSYQGYWESRGYSNTANVNESYFKK